MLFIEPNKPVFNYDNLNLANVLKLNRFPAQVIKQCSLILFGKASNFFKYFDRNGYLERCLDNKSNQIKMLNAFC